MATSLDSSISSYPLAYDTSLRLWRPFGAFEIPGPLVSSSSLLSSDTSKSDSRKSESVPGSWYCALDRLFLTGYFLDTTLVLPDALFSGAEAAP